METKYSDHWWRVLESLPHLVCLCRKGKVDAINSAGVRLLGQGGEARLLGRPFVGLFCGDGGSLVDAPLAERPGTDDLGTDDLQGDVAASCLGALVPGEPSSVVRLRGALGQDVMLRLQVHRVDDRDDDTFLVIGHPEGGAGRQENAGFSALEDRVARLQGILDAIAEGIITTNENGVIVSANRVAEAMFGYLGEGLNGVELVRLMPKEGSAGGARFVERYISKGAERVAAPLRRVEGQRRNGVSFPLELSVVELSIGESRHYNCIVRDITDRRRVEETERRYKQELEFMVAERTRELSRLSRQTQSVLEATGDAIIGLDSNAVVIFANRVATTMLGWDPVGLIGKSAAEIFRYGDERRWGRPVPVRAALRRRIFASRRDVELLRRDGSIFAAEYSSNPVAWDVDEEGVVVVFRDISERKSADERSSVAATVFETTSEGVMVCDSDGIITMANPAFSRMTGWEECLGHHAAQVLFPTTPFCWDEMIQVLKITGRWEHEYWSNRRGGREYAARIAASVIADDYGLLKRVVTVVHDITQRKRDEERIRFQANFDMLTHLPNRMLFHDRLEQAVAASRRSGRRVGLLFIDLDGFKAVNDTWGHAAGDNVLRKTADRLRRTVRECDTVARLGGDEFTVIMTGLDDDDGVTHVAERIVEAMGVPFDIPVPGGGVQAVRVSASVGIAIIPEGGDSAEDLLRNADAAMYQAKEKGKAQFVVFPSVALACSASG